MSDMGGIRPRASMMTAAGNGDPLPPGLERKGVAAGQLVALPMAARLNGQAVQLQAQAQVQVLWSWSPWAQPEPLAGEGAVHYLALAREQVGCPPTDAQLQG